MKQPSVKNAGFLLINKPATWSSHDIVGYLRKVTKIQKIGHAGTLDPFASGLMIIGIGREATKNLDNFKSLPKTYLATLELGKISNTFDPTGELKIVTEKENINLEQIKEVISSFLGEQQQIPPMFSAKKINGKKLYDLARKGIEVERKPAEIVIFSIKILEYSWPLLKTEVKCSAGTYIRSLANDIGLKLGCGAYCKELTRTKIGEFFLEPNIPIPQNIHRDSWYNHFINSK